MSDTPKNAVEIDPSPRTKPQVRFWIAPEGYVHIAVVLVAFVLARILDAGFVSFLLFIALVFVLQFFRDPPRHVLHVLPHDIIAPADGRVVAVMPCTDPYRQTEALKISIFMNVFNVHANKMPTSGFIERVEYHPGSFVNADLDKASTENERNAVLVRTQSGQAITVVQIAGLIARRILCYVGKGEAVQHGQRYGFIRFGSRVDVYLPVQSQASVAIGDTTIGGVTRLATLPMVA